MDDGRARARAMMIWGQRNTKGKGKGKGTSMEGRKRREGGREQNSRAQLMQPRVAATRACEQAPPLLEITHPACLLP